MLEEESYKFTKDIIKDGHFEDSAVYGVQIIDDFWKNYFYLNHRRLLVLKDKIDREELCPQSSYGSTKICLISFVISVSLQEKTTLEKRFVDFIKVNIEVVDMNDNPPIFPSDSVEYNVSENSKIGDIILLERAIDADGWNHFLKSYKLEPASLVEFPFELSNKQDTFLKITKRLILQEYNFNLVASDVIHETKLAVKIKIKKSNSVIPKFSNSTDFIFVDENTQIGALLYHAKTNMMNKDDMFIYSFGMDKTTDKAKAFFTINHTSGIISLKKSLDFEAIQSFEMVIVAHIKHDNKKVGKMKLVVNVLDVNDNSPVIKVISKHQKVKQLNEKSFFVPENEPINTALLYIAVSDRDSKENGRVTCHVSENRFLFLQSITRNLFALILTKTVDFENCEKFDATMICHDHGKEQKIKNLIFDFFVTDVNDNRPFFTQTRYETILWIQKVDLKEYPILTVNAFDQDRGTNSDICYSILNSHDTPFEIDN
ncbi:protocadherin beta-12-like [Octopus sinensis]|uniref:Protocadherin beta-12-like n=1 Tax=Octopus sinensis TaxID=2607531 RepID=A0A6P7TRT2_9MOLL|nr:protocadherin beta-12-like [Octopus sinensis]